MSKSTERVAAGAAWLDEVAPGWERKIDLSTLDIDDPRRCICGQLKPFGVLRDDSGEWYGAWSLADDVLTAQGLDSTNLGLVDGDDTDAWVALIKDRFDSGALSDLEEET